MATPSCGRRVAYLALPTYWWVDQFSGEQLKTAKAVVPVLQTLGILPGSLDTYGRPADHDTLTNLLRAKGFTVEEDGGAAVVRAERFESTVERLATACDRPEDVLVVAFCGHGGVAPTHLTFSDNRTVTDAFLDAALARATGSVYLLLNCCTDARSPLPTDPYRAGVSTSERPPLRRVDILTTWHTSSLDGPPWLPRSIFRCMALFGVFGTRGQQAAHDGTPIVKALVRVVAADPDVTVEQLQARLESIWKDDNMMCTAPVVRADKFTGRLFEPLCRPPKVLHMKCLPPQGWPGLYEWPGMWGYD